MVQGSRFIVRGSRFAFAAFVAVGVVCAGCTQSQASRRLTTALDTRLSGTAIAPADAEAWKSVRAFYEARESRPAWVKPQSPSKRAGAALHIIRQAASHGLVANDYGEAELARLIDELERTKRNARDLQTRLAELDVKLTSAVVTLGRDVALGRPASRANRSSSGTPRPRDFAAILSECIDSDPGSWLERVQPRHPEYAALRRVLDSLRDELEHSGPGDGSPLPELPVGQRIAQVELNLDRWRGMPDDLGARHFIVNIPAFHLYVREQNKTVLDMKVVVGKPGTETPSFSDEMETVVFSPYWNIPDTIALGETAPAAIRDPSYLERNNIEVLSVSRSGTQRIDASSIDWGNPEELERLAFRQKPGAANALGHVKFLFPNPHNVYLHDTPADSLFNRPTRTFSHGCVRVERPEELARYVLRGHEEWDHDRIRRAMYSGNETQVKLKDKIPVHIVYFTVWVDDQGVAHFLPDPYRRDRKS
jgi:murein L,D-transpeptidase YcbB/YkuD